MALFVGYEPAQRCSSGPTPGARALMAWFLGAYQASGGTNLGVFNCRPARGSTTLSLHGEGRAADLGINPHGAGYGTTLADKLRLTSAELGVQCVIWNRRIWSGSYSNAGWRPYKGVNPHVDHLHVELSRKAAAGLTAAQIQQTLGGTPGPAPARSVLRKGDRGPDVAALQRLLRVAADGVFGPATERAVRAHQQAHGLTVDGIAGPATLRSLTTAAPAPAPKPPAPKGPDVDADQEAMLRAAYHELTLRLPNRRGPGGERIEDGGADTLLGYGANSDGFGFRLEAKLDQLLAEVARGGSAAVDPTAVRAALSDSDVRRVADAVMARLAEQARR